MEKFKHIMKAVLLYGTAFYFIIYICIVESLTEVNPQAAFIGLFIFLILLVICRKVFKNEDLDNYRPKWFD